MSSRKAKRCVESKTVPAAASKTSRKIPPDVAWPPFFAVVLTADWDGVDPVCFATSHADAQRKVDALRDELECYTSAGGDFKGAEESIGYFYCDSRGYEVEWDKDKKVATYKRHDEVKDSLRYDAKLNGRRIRVKLDEILYWEPPGGGKGLERSALHCEMDNSSMAFAASNCTGKSEYVEFWRLIRALPFEVVETLREIYANSGDYNEIPSAADLEREEKDDGNASEN